MLATLTPRVKEELLTSLSGGFTLMSGVRKGPKTQVSSGQYSEKSNMADTSSSSSLSCSARCCRCWPHGELQQHRKLTGFRWKLVFNLIKSLGENKCYVGVLLYFIYSTINLFIFYNPQFTFLLFFSTVQLFK